MQLQSLNQKVKMLKRFSLDHPSSVQSGQHPIVFVSSADDPEEALDVVTDLYNTDGIYSIRKSTNGTRGLFSALFDLFISQHIFVEGQNTSSNYVHSWPYSTQLSGNFGLT